MVTLHSHNDVIGLVLLFSFLELVLVLLSRVRNGVKTGTCVTSVCWGHFVLAATLLLLLQPLFSLLEVLFSSVRRHESF